MSHALLSRNADLKRLRDEGYFVQIRGSLLVMREVPYLTAKREVMRGSLISSLNLSGDETRPPDTHQVWFTGEFPCNADGTRITGIGDGAGEHNLGHGLTAKYHFSTKPSQGYSDYYEKMTAYASILSGPAAVLKPGTTPRVFRKPEDENDGVFNYLDTASGRAGIGALSELLASEVVSIVGLGGTGSYLLDLVAKTPVREIRLFDADEFLQHNAFRAPGAPSLDDLRDAPLKVDHLKGIYSKMHRGIVAHPTQLTADNVALLDGTTFAFLCLDAGGAKRAIVEKLEALGVPFIDTGMGLNLNAGTLGGMLRVTASTPEARDHVRKRVPFTGGGADDVYASNIQVADLNALNAVLAAIKWKKLRGFYRDFEREHHCTYTTDGNQLENGDRV